MRLSRLLLVLLALGGPACAGGPAQSPVASTGAGIVMHTWAHGKGLEKNLLDDSPDRSVHIYLPPSYFTHPERRYPAVYLLHGFTGNDDEWLAPGTDRGGPSVSDSMDRGIASGKLREMIVVMPNCNNAYGGCMYINSSVTGAWEDFVVRDLVAFVDEKLRTSSGPSARALIGHSMGGFGALRIAFAHPDVFGVVYAISPGGIDDMLLRQIKPQTFLDASTAKTPEELSHRSFFQRAVIAAGAAYSPDPSAKPLMVSLPFAPGPNGPEPVDAVQRIWSNELATSSIASSRASIAKLRAIGLEVGDHDEVAMIIPTTHAMDRALTAVGIAHDFAEFDGGHTDHLGDRIETAALPFVSRHLSFDSVP